MKKLFQHKPTNLLLLGYLILQLTSLFLHKLLIYLGYEVLFLAAIVVGIAHTIKSFKKLKRLKNTHFLVLDFLIVNLLLTVVYLPVLLYNPELNGEKHGDAYPMIMLTFFPGIHFILAAIILYLSVGIVQISIKN